LVKLAGIIALRILKGFSKQFMGRLKITTSVTFVIVSRHVIIILFE